MWKEYTVSALCYVGLNQIQIIGQLTSALSKLILRCLSGVSRPRGMIGSKLENYGCGFFFIIITLCVVWVLVSVGGAG